MGQSNSEIVETRTILVQNWHPHDNQPNVLVNRITHEQVQKHFIRILVKDLPRQTALFASRMSNHQLFVCRLLYFHPAVPDPRSTQESQKDFREMYLYTDRMLPLRDWSQQKIKSAIQGFKRIVSINGPVKVTQKMICENQKGEIKIWMSQNPVNNHPDSKYMSEEQTVADLATILTKKNRDIAGRLMGCHTLKDIFEKLSQTVRQNSSPYHNYSHRASESGDFTNKKIQFLERGPQNVPYRNVFGEPLDKRGKDQGFLTPKPANKNYENYPQSAFSRMEEQNKPKSNLVSNLVYIQKCRENTKNNQRFQGNAQQKKRFVSTLSRKITIESSFGERNIAFAEEQQKNEANNSKIEKKKLQQKKKPQKLAQVSSFSNLQPHYNFHRFQTTKLGSTNNLFTPLFTSTKNSRGDLRKHYQSTNFTAQGDTKQNSFCNRSAANFGSEEVKRGYDITIINNNVNNFINNITHNHVLKVDSKMHQYQFRSPKNTQTPNQMGQQVKFSNKKPNTNMNAKQKTQFIPVPVFLQQKKRVQNIMDQAASPNSSSISVNNYETKKDLKNTSQQGQQHPHRYGNKNLPKNQSHYAKQKSIEKSSNMANKFNFGTNHSRVSNSEQSPNYPKTPASCVGGFGQNFSSFIKGNNTSFQLKSGLRTKTTEFFARGKDLKKVESSIQNKSFTQNEKAQAEFDNLQEVKMPDKAQSAKIFEEIIQPKPKLDTFSQKVSTYPESVPEEKQNFKKQLRNEFKFLLGDDPPKDESRVELAQASKQKSEVEPMKESKEVQVKEKIIKKQMEFAELKKQALKVLIDI